VVRAVHALPPAVRAGQLRIADEALTRGRPPEPLTHGEIGGVTGGLDHRQGLVEARHRRPPLLSLQRPVAHPLASYRSRATLRVARFSRRWRRMRNPCPVSR